MGKDCFYCYRHAQCSGDHKRPVAIFSLEMSNIQLVNRLISGEAELESDKIKKGNLADYEWEQLVHKTAKLTNAPIYIDDTPGFKYSGAASKVPPIESTAQCAIGHR